VDFGEISLLNASLDFESFSVAVLNFESMMASFNIEASSGLRSLAELSQVRARSSSDTVFWP
jgi:hypothetical protein